MAATVNQGSVFNIPESSEKKSSINQTESGRFMVTCTIIIDSRLSKRCNCCIIKK